MIFNNQIVIRADANTRIGAGHIMRCLALAQAWRQAGGDATFLTVPDSSMLENRLKSEGMTVKHLSARPGSYFDAAETTALAKEINASWVVVDGYQFDGVYQQVLKKSGLSLLFVDDYGHADHYYADLVLNQNIYAHEDLYTNRESYTRLLLSTRYALLRQEFLKWHDRNRKTSEQARKLLVTLGGGDPENVTAKVLEAVEQIKLAGLEVVVVIGGNNPHYGTLQSSIRNNSSDIRLMQNITDMSEMMAWPDIAVSAGGSTCWELAFMGLPAVLLVFADNQEKIASGLDQAGVVINLNRHTEVSVEQVADILLKLIEDYKLRQEMSWRGRELVDGKGSARVVQTLLSDFQDNLRRDSLCAYSF